MLFTSREILSRRSRPLRCATLIFFSMLALAAPCFSSSLFVSSQSSSASSANESLEARRERALWRRIAASTEPADFTEFLDLYPNGQYTAQARARYDELMEGPLWERIKNGDNLETFREYLKKYVNGKFARQAQARVDQLAEAADWKPIETSDDADKLNAFLSKYPNGTFAVQAKEKLGARKHAEVEARNRAEAELKRQTEAEAARRAEAEAKLRAEAEAKLRAEAEAKQRAEAEAAQRAEAETRKRAEAEARERAEAAKLQAAASPEPAKPASLPVVEPSKTDATQNAGPVSPNPVSKPTGTGTIIVTLVIDEPELEILIDNQKPKTIKQISKNQIALADVPCGPHIVRFSHLTIDPFEQDVEVSSNAPLYINPPLERAYVILIIQSEPGAEVFIDDERICWGEGEEGKPGESKKGKSICKLGNDGRTPRLAVTPSEHRIRLTKPGFVGIEKKVTLANKINEIPLKLKSNKHEKRRSD
jgi:hypothetical protein